MLSKTKRLSKIQFDEVFQKGRVFHSPLFVVRVLFEQKDTRFSFVASKKTAKTAVERNASRRKIYNQIKKSITNKGLGAHFIFIAKKSLKAVAISEIEKEINNIFVKSGVLK